MSMTSGPVLPSSTLYSSVLPPSSSFASLSAKVCLLSKFPAPDLAPAQPALSSLGVDPGERLVPSQKDQNIENTG